ncbi:hypothetical protein C8J57DRAFT_1320481 [Mycena rebaudengoi]|nr:hypothetical protein C8J57DRAFT_1334364 [Mycena rebaudengoi]KAJ7271027.1 hypothetical protein C8J57DRAFT_1320481 [Mycena rebaudengoi]
MQPLTHGRTLRYPVPESSLHLRHGSGCALSTAVRQHARSTARTATGDVLLVPCSTTRGCPPSLLTLPPLHTDPITCGTPRCRGRPSSDSRRAFFSYFRSSLSLTYLSSAPHGHGHAITPRSRHARPVSFFIPFNCCGRSGERCPSPSTTSSADPFFFSLQMFLRTFTDVYTQYTISNTVPHRFGCRIWAMM